MKPKQIAYAGWKNCLSLSNGVVEIVATLDVGPRILRFARCGGPNFFKEFGDDTGKTGGDTWKSYGGHRLWRAPEIEPDTYYPDNRPVQHTWDGATLTLTPPVQDTDRLQFEMRVSLFAERPVVEVAHRITNAGDLAMALAPWCLTVMAGGGRAVIPQEDFIPHGEKLLPARPLVLWHYTRMNDPRLIWGDRFLQIRADASMDAKTKIGVTNTKGWAAYLLDGEIFIKHFPYKSGVSYPDMGCNFECYTQPGFLELESLGPLTTLEPGASVEHTERWFIAAANFSEDEKDVERILVPMVEDSRV